MNRLHITNGDSTSSALIASSVEGDVLPWRDVLHDGPVPEALSLDDMSRVRSFFLSSTFAVLNHADVTNGFIERDRVVQNAEKFDETTLWFEHDLYDQLQLLQILDWFQANPLADDRLQMICINAFEGVDPFFSLGQLTPEQLATLDPTRAPVTAEQLALGARGWDAFTAADPGRLCRLIDSDTSALPFLGAALYRQIEEYPWVGDGLSRVQRTVLQLVLGGTAKPGLLFSEHQHNESAPFMGDWSFWLVLESLINAEHPALGCATGEPFSHPPGTPGLDRNAFLGQDLELTSIGEDLLASNVDWIELNGIDHWIGGVHLTGVPDWRFDPDQQTVVRRVNFD